jgi:splicing factor 3A subunit 3
MTEENTKKRPREEDASISSEPSVSVASQAPTTGPIDLTNIESAAELEKFGLEHLKQELMRLGMICGGDLKQRAERLFRVKGKSLSEIDPALLVANRNKKRKV